MSAPPAAAERRRSWPGDALFFIVGRGRSGSTLLSQMLDAHPALAVAPEALFVIGLHRRHGRAPPWDGAAARRFSRDLWREERLKRWNLDRARVEGRLSELPSGTSYAEACATVYALAAEGRGKHGRPLLGDKNPLHALFTATLTEAFPRARFVHLVRDHRDNVLSFRNVPFDLDSVASLAVRWRLYNEAVLRASRREPQRFVRIAFEDLLRDPERTLRTVCAFLEVGWDPAMLTADRVPSWGLPAWHAKIAEPLDPGQAGKWRQGLPPDEVALADAICQPLAGELGYPPAVADRAPLPWRARAGVAFGTWATRAELVVPRLPPRVHAALVRAYRRSTGNVIR